MYSTIEPLYLKRGGGRGVLLYFQSHHKNIIFAIDCPVIALTGTADPMTQETICKELLLKSPCKLFVSPNRTNLRFSVLKVKKNDMTAQLDWLIDMVKEHGINTPKTIIFCDTMYAIANVANYMMMQLGCSAFYPASSDKREDCLIGIMHSAIQQEYKQRLLQSLKGEGTKRIAIATTSLSMGVNFPNIRYVFMFGLPRSMLDLHQEAGRGGRDGLPTDVRICFYGQQVSHCDSDVRCFVNANGCYRVAAYSSFDASIISSLPAHQCCNFCAKTCCCVSEGCNEPIKTFEAAIGEKQMEQRQTRTVSDEDRNVLKESLQQMVSGMLTNTMSPFGETSVHGFSQELVSDVVENCHSIFTQEDLFKLAPTFSRDHAHWILGLFSELFDDIDESSLISDETVCADKSCNDCNKVTGLDELFSSMNDFDNLPHDFDELDIFED